MALIVGHMATSPRRTADYPEDNLAQAELISLGLPARRLEETASEFGVGVLELAETLQLARRTVTRRMAQKKRLTPGESEKILRVNRLLRLAKEVFGDDKAAHTWFTRKLRVLGHRSPLELCATEPGGKEVEDELGRFEHGIFA
jgi:putative toxin-antitoxin system antitoxin component (TIGR02293 family)